jgi:ferritin-like metal-binding protein YciE
MAFRTNDPPQMFVVKSVHLRQISRTHSWHTKCFAFLAWATARRGVKSFFYSTWRQHMKLESLHDLFVDELKDLYNAETQLLKALPKMAKAAASEELRTAFEDHLAETEGQVQRLETIFKQLEKNPKGKKCKAMSGLIEEGKEMIEAEGEDPVKDAGLIAAAQRVEHYEMAGYGTVRTYAELLGFDEAAKLLEETLNEEKAADEKLSELAQNINVEAETPA